MKILPIIFYLQPKYGDSFTKNNDAYEVIHNISALTHRHKRSQMACGIYLSIASNILIGTNLDFAVKSRIYDAMEYYKNKEDFKEELHHFYRIENKNFKELQKKEIDSGGYIVSTLEASIWCLLNINDFRSCVLLKLLI